MAVYAEINIFKYVVLSGGLVSMCRRNLLPPSSGWKMEEGDSRLLGNIESYLLGYYFFRDGNILKDTEEISRYL